MSSAELTLDYEAAGRGTALFDWRQSVIELAGRDAKSFLHNLCTNDILTLAPGQGREFFLTTHKAKVVGHGVVNCVRRDKGEVLWLTVDADRADGVFKHLSHYLISEQAEIISRAAELSSLLVLGPESPRVLESIAGAGLDKLGPWEMMEMPNGVGHVRRQSYVTPLGFEFFVAASEVTHLRDQLIQKDARAAGEETFEVLRIEAGWPMFGRELDENRFVVETDRISQSISYAKGCYLGQEPIVMARDRGQVNRHLVGLRVPGQTPVAAGAKLLRDGAEVGQVTSSAFSPGVGEVVCLAYVKRGNQEPGTVLAISDDPAGRRATVGKLPVEPNVLSPTR